MVNDCNPLIGTISDRLEKYPLGELSGVLNQPEGDSIYRVLVVVADNEPRLRQDENQEIALVEEWKPNLAIVSHMHAAVCTIMRGIMSFRYWFTRCGS
jgi:hypothetical protein